MLRIGVNEKERNKKGWRKEEKRKFCYKKSILKEYQEVRTIPKP